MKKIIILAFAAAAVLAGCRKEFSTVDFQETQTITMEAGFASDASKLAFEADGKGYKTTWTATDIVRLYYNNNNGAKGALFTAPGDVTPKDPATSASIKFNVTGLSDVSGNIQWGAYATSGKENLQPAYDYWIDNYAAQDGTEASAQKLLFYYAGDANVLEDFKSPVTFNCANTMLKFTLTFPDGVTGTASEITISGTDLYTTAKYSWGVLAPSASTKGSITVSDQAITEGKITFCAVVAPATVGNVKVTAKVGAIPYEAVVEADTKELAAGKVYNIARTAVAAKDVSASDFVGKWNINAKLFDPNRTFNQGNTNCYTKTVNISLAEGENGNNILIKGLYLDAAVEGKIALKNGVVKLGVYVSSKKIYPAGNDKYCVLLPECNTGNQWASGAAYNFCPKADKAFSSTNYDWVWFDYNSAENTFRYVYKDAGQKSENDAYYYCGLSFVTASSTEITGTNYDVIYQANYDTSNPKGMWFSKNDTVEITDFIGNYDFYNYSFKALSNTTQINHDNREDKTAVQIKAAENPGMLNGHMHNLDLVGLYNSFVLPVSVEITDNVPEIRMYLSKDFQTVGEDQIAVIPELTNSATYSKGYFAPLSFGADNCNYAWVGWGYDLNGGTRITIGSGDQRLVTSNLWFCGFSVVKSGYSEGAYTTIYQLNYKNQWAYSANGGAFFEKTN